MKSLHMQVEADLREDFLSVFQRKAEEYGRDWSALALFPSRQMGEMWAKEQVGLMPDFVYDHIKMVFRGVNGAQLRVAYAPNAAETDRYRGLMIQQLGAHSHCTARTG